MQLARRDSNSSVKKKAQLNYTPQPSGLSGLSVPPTPRSFLQAPVSRSIIHLTHARAIHPRPGFVPAAQERKGAYSG